MTNRPLRDPYPKWDFVDVPEYKNYQHNRMLMNWMDEYYQQAYHWDSDTLRIFEYELCCLNRPFIREGQLLFFIFDNFMYKEKGYKSFTTYCREVHGLQYWQVEQKVNASRIASHLLSVEFKVIPKNIHQCKSLMYLENPNVVHSREESAYERIEKVWKIVTDRYKEAQITGKIIEQIIKIEYPEFIPQRLKAQVILDLETAEMLDEIATDERVGKNELIKELLVNRNLENNFTEQVYDYEHDETVKEVVLWERFRELCGEVRVNFNDILEKIVSVMENGIDIQKILPNTT